MRHARSIITLTLLALVAAVPPVFAQGAPEGDEEESSGGGFFIELGTWIAQPTGIELEPVTRRDPSDPFGTRPIAYSDQTDTELYFKLGYDMGQKYGKFMAWVYDYEQKGMALAESTPGTFQFGETLANPLFAGVGLDGLADAYDSTASITMSDFRIDYSRTAFENSRVKGEWFVGWRRVKFDREMTANYYALVPGFPPLLPPLTPPIPSLDPQTDSAGISSRFEGRGLTAGMNFQIPLIRDRLRLDASFALSALRGDISSSYNSTTHYYSIELSGVEYLLAPPYSAFGETVITNPTQGETGPLAQFIDQKRLRTGLTVDGRSTSASILDINLELRYRAWKGLEVILGFRDTRYENVALDLRNKVSITPLGSTNVSEDLLNTDGDPIRLESPTLLFNTEDVTETERSVTMEGFYLGVSYSF